MNDWTTDQYVVDYYHASTPEGTFLAEKLGIPSRYTNRGCPQAWSPESRKMRKLTLDQRGETDPARFGPCRKETAQGGTEPQFPEVNIFMILLFLMFLILCVLYFNMQSLRELKEQIKMLSELIKLTR